jgi:hypothetical protein
LKTDASDYSDSSSVDLDPIQDKSIIGTLSPVNPGSGIDITTSEPVIVGGYRGPPGPQGPPGPMGPAGRKGRHTIIIEEKKIHRQFEISEICFFNQFWK